MKKLIAVLITILAFLCDNEILTLLLIGVGAAIVAVILLRAWAKTEKQSLPGSFDVDWGRK